MQDITGLSGSLHGVMERVSALSQRVDQLLVGGQSSLGEAQASIHRMVSASFGLREHFARVEERAREIELSLRALAFVVDRSNLLSINAAIEAENAGKLAMGFHAIAQEIGRLSDRTDEAAVQIERGVAEMQEAVASGLTSLDTELRREESAALEAAQRWSAGLSTLLGEVGQLCRGLGEVQAGVASQTDVAHSINLRSVELSRATRDTARAVSECCIVTEQLQDSVTSFQGVLGGLYGAG